VLTCTVIFPTYSDRPRFRFSPLRSTTVRDINGRMYGVTKNTGQDIDGPTNDRPIANKLSSQDGAVFVKESTVNR